MRYLFTAGHMSDGVIEDGQRSDPLNPLVWAQTAWARFTRGELAACEAAARRALDLSETGNPIRTYIASILGALGRRGEAIAIFEEVSGALGDSTYGSVSAFLAKALRGDADGAVSHVTPLLEQSAHWVEYLAGMLADGYALIGHRDEALRWLRKAVDQGFINYPYIAEGDPFLDSIRGDAEFKELLEQVHRRWQAFDA
jgi:tetratricopeptide (TPR) repeat protein